ncbi:hypothetical protein GCM10027445_67200 [Amycolatopsis endophytica]|uniref:Uncharacterized protein n=1 Tax=Amycolatopsis endophytica TaxID=860233 RepID=A0A853AXN6_9PSEU|nr:hypothetical protein [Amycolatopsis endophytica]NYI87384.1 hypothetical protein [Amycolatopsis endophytica]
MSEELLARSSFANRQHLQCADVILLEAVTLVQASWQLSSTFARYPGCLVVAVRHECGQWALLAVREHGFRMVRPGFAERIGWPALEARARDTYSRAVAS